MVKNSYGTVEAFLPPSAPEPPRLWRCLGPLVELGVALGAVALAVRCGLTWFASDVVRGRGSGEYTAWEFWNLVCWVVLGPLAMVGVVRGSFDLATSRLLPSNLVSYLLSLLISGALAALALSLGTLAASFLKCAALLSCRAQRRGQQGVVEAAGLAYAVACIFVLTLWVPPLFDLACQREALAQGRRPRLAQPSAAKRRAGERAGVALATAALAVVLAASVVLPASPANFDQVSTWRVRPDVCAWYAFIAGVAWASRRQYLRREAYFWAGLATLVSGLSGYWWLTRPGPPLERLGRVFGEIANVLLGLVMLPISRNSAVATELGVPHDVLLGVHGNLGRCFAIAVVAHAGLFYAARPALYPPSDWTTPLACVVVGGALVALISTSMPRVRRDCWDCFKIAHFAALPLLAAAVWHAPSSWTYVGGATMLYLADRVLRFHKGRRRPSRVECRVVDDIVVLSYVHDAFPMLLVVSQKTRPTSLDAFDAGQYAWIRARGVGDYSWHPVSYSSSPLDATTTHHVQVRESDQWAAALASGRVLDLDVDGPYGSPPALRRRVLLVAGGVGVTPCASILRTVLLGGADCERVTLVWVAKRRHLFYLFADALQLRALTKDQPTQAHAAMLYETGYFVSHADHLAHAPRLVVRRGRPDLDAHLDTILAGLDDPSQALVFASGPHSLIDAVCQAARSRGAQFHAESFTR